jgi:predicted porin
MALLVALPAKAAEGLGSAAISEITPYISEPGASGKLGSLNIRPIAFQSEIEVDTTSAFTERTRGVQFGVRYAASPNEGLSTQDIKLECAVCTTGSGDWLAPLPGSLELGVNYSAGSETVNLEFAGSYFAAEPERTNISLDAARSWGVGGKIDFKLGSAGALALGGSYSNRNYVSLTGSQGRFAGLLTDETSAWAWDAGLSYAYGPWMLGGYYQTSEVDVASALAAQITSLSPGLGGRAIALQGGYRVAPGVALAAGVQFWDYQNSTLNLSAAGQDRLKDGSSTVVFLETAVDF